MKINTAEKIRNYFQSISSKEIKEKSFIENELILTLGLNDEMLNEQPQELSDHFGKGFGLKIWQYPNQFADYLHFISDYANKINSYLEIGCRHGGTYIFTTEYLKKLNVNFNKSVSVDIVDLCPILKEYLEFNSICEFKKVNSLSSEFRNYINDTFFDLVFIDGDHEYRGVRNDSELTKEKCNIQVYHDIVNDVCPGVVNRWREVKETYKDTHNFYEFVDQYESVNGSYLGIGVAVRKEWIFH